MDISRKAMAAIIVAVLCIAGIGTALAYTATVNNSGNNSSVDGFEISFYTKENNNYVEITTDGQVLKNLSLNSEREHGTTTWKFNTGGDALTKSGIYIKGRIDGKVSPEGTVVVTITGITVPSGSTIAGTDFTAKLGDASASSIGIENSTMTIKFPATAISGTDGLELVIKAYNSILTKSGVENFKIENGKVSATLEVS